MANRYAVASGNWSSLATWDGGASLPGAADIVRPNGFNVTIDQNISVTALRNDASAPAAANGTFILTGNYTLTISSDIQCFATSLLTYNGTGTAYITGANSTAVIISSTTTNTTNTVTHSGTGTLVVDMVLNSIQAGSTTRNSIAVTGGGTLTCLQEVNAASANQGAGIGCQIIQTLTTAGATLNLKNVRGGTNTTLGVVCNIKTFVNIIGSVYSGSTNTGYALWNTDNASVINITGNVIGTTNGNAGGAIALLNSSAPINLLGNIIGGGSGTVISTSGSLTMTGNIIGNTTQGIALSIGTNLSVTGNITGNAVNAVTITGGSCTVIGTITGGTANGSVGIIITGGALNHIGTVQASAFGSGIYNSSPVTAQVTLTGPFVSNGYIVPVACQSFYINSAYNPSFTFRNTSAVDGTYVDSSSLNFPSTSNVRLGTSYGAGLYTGTLAMAIPSNVSLGVATDATTGTAVITAADFLTTLSTSSDPLAIRLRNVSTVATMGKQLASYNI